MSRSIKKLYNQIILKREKEPVGFGKLEEPDQILEAYNPLCGDHYNLYLKLEDGLISTASFHGYGCALSKVSTSLLIERLHGKPLGQCKEFIQGYFEELNHPTDDSHELILALSMAKDFPGRHQCTVLSWERLLKFILNSDDLGHDAQGDF